MKPNLDDRPGRDLRGYLMEVAWAFVLINVIVGLVGWLAGQYMGEPRLGVTLFLGGSLVVTTVLGCVVVCNAVIVAVVSRIREGRERAGFSITDEEPPAPEDNPPPVPIPAHAGSAGGDAGDQNREAQSEAAKAPDVAVAGR